MIGGANNEVQGNTRRESVCVCVRVHVHVHQVAASGKHHSHVLPK